MWFIGLVAGAFLGGAIGSIVRWDEAWMLFAALGTVAGILYREKMGKPAPALEARLTRLEREIAALKQRVDLPERLAAEPSPQPQAVAPPVAEGPTSLVVEPPPAAVIESLVQPSPPPVPAQPARRVAPKPPAQPSRLYEALFRGNILAKIGVVLLLIGIGSGLKLAIDFGMFPPAVRLLIATVAGLGMIGFGYTRMRIAKHRMFGLALQGGGFGVLYVVTYFAFARHGYIGPIAAFGLFAGLGIACIAAAWRFEGEPLAILGLSGAFMAPLLASTGEGSYLVLFSYYAVLDAIVVAVTVIRAWRVLTLTALGFTLLTGALWATTRFTPAAFAHTEGFLLFYFAIFSFAPAIRAMLGKASKPHWADVVLMFGTPIAAATAQNWLFARMGYDSVALAWNAVGAGVYYSALAALLYARKATEALRIAHSAIAIGFYTVAIPLAFGVPLTSAFWAIEGLALAWFGMSQRRGLPYAAGLLFQLAAGFYFLKEWNGARAMPVLNAFYIGCIVIAICGTWTAWLSKRYLSAEWLGKQNAQAFPSIAAAWALGWWLAANFSEIARFAPRAHEIALYLSVWIVTSWIVLAIGRALPSTIARYAALALAAPALLGGLADGWGRWGAHPMHDSMAFALPAAFVSAYAIMHRHERDGLNAILPAAHVYALLMLAITLIRESLWIAGQMAPGVELWPAVAWMLAPAALVYAIVYLARLNVWPVNTQAHAYLLVSGPALLAVAFLAALNANMSHDGGAPGLPYLPVASFFDVSQLAVVFALYAWTRTMQPRVPDDLVRVMHGITVALVFIWLSAMVMRLAHHWGDVPFNMAALMASGLAQSMLSIVWTAIALTLMINATRRVARQRWFLGFALLGIVGAKFILVDVANKGTVAWTLSLIGVGLLILAASYFSPAPPKAPQ